MNNQIDPLTGGSYDSEKYIYIKFHKLTDEEATLIMSKLTHKERDDAFNKIKGFFNDEEAALISLTKVNSEQRESIINQIIDNR